MKTFHKSFILYYKTLNNFLTIIEIKIKGFIENMTQFKKLLANILKISFDVCLDA